MTNQTLKLRLKKVDPVKYAMVTTLVYLSILVIVYAPFILLFSLIGGASDIGAGAMVLGGGIFGIIMMLIIGGIIVFVITIIAALILNFILKKTGGIDIDFEKIGFDFNPQQGNQDLIEQ